MKIIISPSASTARCPQLFSKTECAAIPIPADVLNESITFTIFKFIFGMFCLLNIE